MALWIILTIVIVVIFMWITTKQGNSEAKSKQEKPTRTDFSVSSFIQKGKLSSEDQRNLTIHDLLSYERDATKNTDRECLTLKNQIIKKFEFQPLDKNVLKTQSDNYPNMVGGSDRQNYAALKSLDVASAPVLKNFADYAPEISVKEMKEISQEIEKMKAKPMKSPQDFNNPTTSNIPMSKFEQKTYQQLFTNNDAKYIVVDDIKRKEVANPVDWEQQWVNRYTQQ